jgi:hypothetical protein
MKPSQIILAVVASAALPISSLAADAPQNLADRGPLQIVLTVTDKGNELFDSWDHPTGKPFGVEPIKSASRGQFLSAVVLFKGCMPDSCGNCNAVMDVVAYDPNGKVYGEMPRVELWQRKQAPDPGYTQLSRSYMGLVIEPGDPPGTYRVTVVARDLVAKTEARSEALCDVK